MNKKEKKKNVLESLATLSITPKPITLFLPLELLGKDLHFVYLRGSFSTEEQLSGSEIVTVRNGSDTGKGLCVGWGWWKLENIWRHSDMLLAQGRPSNYTYCMNVNTHINMPWIFIFKYFSNSYVNLIWDLLISSVTTLTEFPNEQEHTSTVSAWRQPARAELLRSLWSQAVSRSVSFPNPEVSVCIGQ